MRLKEQASQPDSSAESSEPCEVNELDIYLEAAGGTNKRRVYGWAAQPVHTIHCLVAHHALQHVVPPKQLGIRLWRLRLVLCSHRWSSIIARYRDIKRLSLAFRVWCSRWLCTWVCLYPSFSCSLSLNLRFSLIIHLSLPTQMIWMLQMTLLLSIVSRYFYRFLILLTRVIYFILNNYELGFNTINCKLFI